MAPRSAEPGLLDLIAMLIVLVAVYVAAWIFFRFSPAPRGRRAASLKDSLMSILSVAWNRLRKGDNPLGVFRDAKAQIDGWVVKLEGKLPAEAKAALDAAVADVKQGLSDAAGAVGDILPGLLAAPTAAIDEGFAALATSYLGPVVGGVLSKAQADALNRIEAALIATVRSAKLTHIAAATGVAAASAPEPPH